MSYVNYLKERLSKKIRGHIEELEKNMILKPYRDEDIFSFFSSKMQEEINSRSIYNYRITSDMDPITKRTTFKITVAPNKSVDLFQITVAAVSGKMWYNSSAVGRLPTRFKRGMKK